MDIRVLRYFLAVARIGSVTKAASFLNITQPTLSRQIAQLEDELSVKLFRRDQHYWQLTESGVLLRRRAQEMVELMEKTEKEILQQDLFLNGTVSVCCGEHQAIEILGKLFKKFHELYPEVRFEVYTATSEYAVERLTMGLADIGIFSEPYENVEQYDYLPLGETEQWCVIMSKDDPLAQKDSITPEDLKDRAWIFPWRMKVKSVLGNWLGDYYQEKNILVNSNLRTNGAFMVAAGLGVLLTMNVPGFLINNDILTCRPFNPPLKARTSLVWMKHKPLTVTTSRFLEFARQYLHDKGIN